MAALRARLREAEELLGAIRRGEVDAIVRPGPAGEQVFTLEGADRPYRIMVETMAEGAVTLDPDGSITYCNKQFAALVDAGLDRVIGSKIEDFVVPEERGRLDAALRRARGRTVRDQLAFRRLDGSKLPAYVSMRGFGSAEDRTILAIVNDLTEIKRAEETSERLARIVESAGDAIIAKDLAGNITSWNHGAEIVYGYTAAEAIGRSAKILSIPGREQAIDDLIREIRGGRAVSHVQIQRRRKDGTIVEVSLSLSAIHDQAGGIVGVSAIARDITERRRFEQALHDKNVELEHANIVKDKFLATMSHELRTPLNAILGFTGTLLMKLPGPLVAEQERQLKTVQSSALHLLSLINDLLDLAKIESGKVELSSEPVVCNGVVREVVATLTPMAELKGLRLLAEIPRGDIVATLNRRGLSQILINLVNNAIKFTESGEVRVVLRPGPDADAAAEIAVIDTGIGIRVEDQPKLFEAFSRVVEPGARRDEGAGLGLHLSRKLAQMMHARVRFTSEHGKGSEFVLELPRAA